MLRNRLIVAILIILSGVFVTLFGGVTTYTLFFLCLSLPLVSLFYLFYVYYRFRIYQLIDHKTITKGETVPYRFILANEDIVSYVKVNNSFYSDLSTVTQLDSSKEYSLIPGDKIEKNGTLVCNYRGQYKVGIDKVEIQDFFRIYSLNYSCPTPIEVTVNPRVISLPTLSIAPNCEDEKVNNSFKASFDIIDSSVRDYAPGDPLKSIHWKSSAKTGKLQTRKYIEEPKPTMSVFLDLTKPCENTVENIIITDTFIECALAIVNYFYSNGTSCQLVSERIGQVKSTVVRTKPDFDKFYSFCCEVNFTSKIEFSSLIELGLSQLKSSGYCFFITTKADANLAKACTLALNSGNIVTVILISKDRVALPDYFDNRIKFCAISTEDDVAQVLA